MSAEALEASSADRHWVVPSWRALLDIRVQIAAAMLVGFALRFWRLSSVPPGLNQDEAMYGYDAYSILMTGRDHLGHPFPFASLETFGDWSSPLLTYLSIPFVALFGLNVEALRGTSALIGVAAVPIVFALTLTLFKRRDLALAAMWVLAVLPWAVHLSRWAIIPTVVPTMVAATLLALIWALEHRNDRAIVAAALLAALTVASYHAMKVYVPLLCLAVAAVYWRDLRRMRLEPMAYAAAVFIAIAGPVFWLTARDPGGGARLAQTSILNDHALTPGLLLSQYAAYFSPAFWFTSGYGDPMHLPAGWGLAPLTLAPFLLAGLAWLAWHAVRGRDRSAIVLLLAIALVPIPGMMTLPNPHVLRAVHVIPLAALVAGAGVIAVVDTARTLLASRRHAWLIGATAAGVLVLTAMGAELAVRYNGYFGSYPDEVAENFRYGMQDAMSYVAANEADYDEVWVDDNNSSYIFVLFYKRWDPSDVHSNLTVRRNPPGWNHVSSIGKYRFGAPDTLTDRRVEFKAFHPRAGNAGYEVVSGRLDGKRIAVIERRVK